MTTAECFHLDAPVYFDDLDANGHLHNSRFLLLVERAQSALFERLGGGWLDLAARDPDLRYVVRAVTIEFLATMAAPGVVRVGLSADRLGRTSADYGFRCVDPADARTLATGHRSIVKVDEAGRPAPWSEGYRQVFSGLQAGSLPGLAADR